MIVPYDSVRRIGDTSIEIYRDGLSIAAHLSRRRKWAKFAICFAISVILGAIAIPHNDDSAWQGLSIHRDGPLARIAASIVGTAFAAAAIAVIRTPRTATTLIVRAGHLAYSEARVRGKRDIEYDVKEIQSVEYEPWTGDSGGRLGIVVAGSGYQPLFPRQTKTERAAVGEELTSLWQRLIQPASGASGARNEIPRS